MKEKLIDIETAKLAKEKGFDEGCSFFHGSWEDYEGIHHMDNYNRHNTSKQFSAPTQGLLQKWLREVKNIDVVAIPVRFTGYLEIGYYTYAVCGIQPMKNYRFDTYEEALEIGLVEGLKLIEP